MNFLRTLIGKKVIVSLSGLFLMIFLLVHMSINLALIFDHSMQTGGKFYDQAVHFMSTNPMMKIMEPVLAIGFLVHIIFSIIVSIQNMRARPKRYLKVRQEENASWASRNMIILGLLIFLFIIIHMSHFFVDFKMGNVSGSHYEYVIAPFVDCVVFNLIYIFAAIFLWLHLSHGFWSAFQSIGLSNDLWRKRLTIIGKTYSFIVAGGFISVPIYFLFLA